MSAEETSVCPHARYLPKEQHPQIRGVTTAPCWTIPFDDIPNVYPNEENWIAEFWRTHIQKPWYKSYGKKYRNNIQGCYCTPYFTLMHLDRTKYPDDLYMVVIISDNRDEEGIAFSENQEFLDDMRRMTHIDESIAGGLKWIRAK
ncbi:hypothetical protein BDP27DRAFT_1369067 [Rhodocollybia butyracea]|uniref:Uncharacterized protein n=1 Tax=Rhodocollybia butyracea TaxID=206335 RepID=A0A9P5PBU6_9AGAR|nr:hypothetical protein BDP27DRAFT_1369067 [Rhodocollybia butyracea]